MPLSQVRTAVILCCGFENDISQFKKEEMKTGRLVLPT